MSAYSRYGRQVDQLARTRYGISGEALLKKLVQGESGGSMNRTSSMGAKGAAQFMPAARQTAIRKYGIDPWRSKDEAIHAAELHLRGKINGSKGLEGYNPGDPNYPAYILGQKVGHSKGGGGGSSLSYTPGASHAQDRRLAVLDWYRSRESGKPQSALDLATTIHNLADEPGTLKRTKGGGSTGSGSTSVVAIGKMAQKEGLHVGENPHFGGVNPVHVKGSYHYKGRAIDVSGSPAAMRRFAHQVAARYGKNLKELFWQGAGGIDIKNGQRVAQGFVTGHTDHVHVAI